MSSEHKAFLFNDDAFYEDFYSILIMCLETNDIKRIKKYIELNKKYIRNPYEGEFING